jgi:hypothetical protein
MKTIYFVVAVDLETGTKYIDDNMLTSLPCYSLALDNNTKEWTQETDEEYAMALSILNNGNWECE